MFYLKLIAEHVKRHINIKVHVFDTNLYPNIMAGQFHNVETWTKEVIMISYECGKVPVIPLLLFLTINPFIFLRLIFLTVMWCSFLCTLVCTGASAWLNPKHLT